MWFLLSFVGSHTWVLGTWWMSWCDQTRSQLHISSVNNTSLFQGLSFLFVAVVNFLHVNGEVMLLLVVSDCNGCLEMTCEIRQETLFVCVLCGTCGNKQQVAKGMASIESKRERGYCRTSIRSGVQRQRRTGLWFLGCIYCKLCRIKSLQKELLLFDFCCANSYIMASVVFLLMLGFIRD